MGRGCAEGLPELMTISFKTSWVDLEQLRPSVAVADDSTNCGCWYHGARV
jgi:hypothetical protein